MNDEFENTIRIDDINSNGQGIGKLEGKAIFVNGAIPGDIVKIEIVKDYKNYSLAKIIKLIEPSEKRDIPPCNVAKKCGGCSFQFMSYENQLDFKRKNVIESLVRIGGFDRGKITDACKEILGMQDNKKYRNKVQIPVGGMFDKPQIGFYEYNSHKIVDNDDCIVQHDAANIIRTIIREYITKNRIVPYDEISGYGLLRHIFIRIGFNTKQVMVVLCVKENKKEKFTDLIELIELELKKIGYNLTSFYLNINDRRTNIVLGREFILLYGKEYIEEILCNVRFKISPNAFFQVNTIQAEKMFEKVIEYANLNKNDTVFDLYCGTGAIALLLAKYCKKVYGVEIVSEAISDAKENAKANKIFNTEFIIGKSEEVYYEKIKEDVNSDVVVLDPPRKGVDRKLLDVLVENRPNKIVYVSCNPATLARDCKILCDNNKFEIKKVLPVDMFPWTGHVETVVLLEIPRGGQKQTSVF